LWVDGQPAQKGERRGQYRLRKTDGTEALAELRPRATGLDPVPDVTIGGETFQLAPPLRWYEWAWILLPLLLLFVGGAVGAALGGAAAFQNAHLFRSGRSLTARYAFTGALSLGAAAVYVLVAAVARGLS
jgi:hypothetical protein